MWSFSGGGKPGTSTLPGDDIELEPINGEIEMAEPEPEPMERRLSHVQDLARQFSRTSLHSTRGKPILIPDLNDLSSPLNPNGDKFNARAWASNIAKVASERGQSFRQLGICFQNLNVHGYGTPTDFQKDVANVWVALPAMIRGLFSSTAGKTKINILSQFDGLVRPGEMCVVLGPPGSGCSTLLKTLAGNTDGFIVDENSYINYQGISPKEMHSAHLGDAIYTAEVDVHFPQLTVGETLSFASHARCQRELPLGLSRDQYCKHLRDVVMAMYGISHTINTKVGDNFVRGVSGGERKRVTIAEATLANAPFQCWDNSTRGLDSSNALEFIKTLRLQSDLFSQTSLVSIYQSPQAAYSLFDKITLLYSGHQIYFGPIASAKEYFESLGFICPPRQTTPDFLTSMTFPSERLIRPDFHPPSTPEEFVSAWKSSPQYAELQQSILEYKSQFPINGPSASIFRTVKQTQKSSGKRRQNSPYILTYTQQILLCIWRSYRRFKSDPIPTLSILFGNTIMALIMSSLFYNLPTTTQSFYGRTVVLFMAILFNAFASVLELMTLYAHRPIVEKQSRLYGFYRGSAEAVASVVVELPVKLVGCLSFNLVFYFMTNLNRGDGAGNFWFYLGVVFLVVLGMSGVFRFIGSLSRTESQAMVPASVLMIALLVFAGFIVPIDYMLPWCRWINYLDPIAYGYEALVINEFHGRNFTCASHIPDYLTADPKNVACDAVGAVAGQNWVSGDAYIKSAFSYIPSHKWRNVGILIAMVIFNHVAHFVTAEYVTAKKSKGEVLVFRQGFVPTRKTNDVEASSSGRDTAILDRPGADKGKSNFQGSTSVFHWNNVCYNIKIKGKTRRILNNIDGWIKPGTLTALMGASGAGKTTLLDCLADRRGGVGVITGEMLVNGKLRDESFQRKTGYAQQQDLHLDTSTVREALTFSALLRQPASAPKNEKLAYVNEVIKMLDMEEYADAVVGILGEGLNVEQRKRLTIGVELVAKPPLLLFVDEPTSGLDSQTSWAILDLLEKLSKAGQSILCTIHQPSAMLFQRFDRLLLLAEGGKTVYFGDIGPNSSTLISYFERNGALRCPPETNPAEWMLQITSSPSPTKLDWPTLWRLSPEYTSIQTELTRLRTLPTPSQSLVSHHSEFALPLHKQLPLVLTRTFTHLNRSPSYIYPKLLLSLLTSLFIGLVFFNSPLTIQALQNQSFAIFELLAITNQLIDQQLPSFITQRQLYEIRERPAKTYSWVIFMLSQILAEIPWYIICSVIIYVCFYFPIGLYNHATEANQQTERGILMYLLFLQFTIWVSTFTHLCASFSETITDAGNAANFLFVFAFFFCGVLRSPNQMPKVWIWLYRASPLSYWVSAVLSVGLGNSKVTCAENELVKFFAPEGESCEGYMKEYMERIGGYLLSGEGNECRYCRVAETNVFLKGISAEYGTRWRNFGIVWVYVLFNVLAACGFYWLVRIPKGRKRV